MKGNWLYYLAKTLEGAGMVIVLVGLLISMDLGMEDEGLKSMTYESWGLVVGLAMFAAGYLIERSIGSR